MSLRNVFNGFEPLQTSFKHWLYIYSIYTSMWSFILTLNTVNIRINVHGCTLALSITFMHFHMLWLLWTETVWLPCSPTDILSTHRNRLKIIWDWISCAVQILFMTFAMYVRLKYILHDAAHFTRKQRYYLYCLKQILWYFS